MTKAQGSFGPVMLKKTRSRLPGPGKIHTSRFTGRRSLEKLRCHLSRLLLMVKDLGLQTLKGVAAPMIVYRVLQRKGTRSRLNIASARVLTPLVGREQEVELLLERWKQVKVGQGQVMLLSGEGGIGKSRLVQEFKQQITDDKLVKAEILYQKESPPGATFTFKHALIQDAAYQSLLKSSRQQYHRDTAQVLEAQFPDCVESEPELLAHHYTEAGLPERAFDYWQKIYS